MPSLLTVYTSHIPVIAPDTKLTVFLLQAKNELDGIVYCYCFKAGETKVQRQVSDLALVSNSGTS